MKVLIVIDIQNGLTTIKKLYNEKMFIDTINRAIDVYRKSEFKIIFVQHNNMQLRKDSFDWEIDQRLDKRVNDIVIQKKHGNAFMESDLKTTLISFGIKQITIGGLVSHGCVKATCLGGIAEGFETSILKNGHTNWNKDAKAKIDQTEKELIENGVKIEKI